MDITLGKRKSPPGDSADESAVLFAEVPEVCWQLVSSYAVPPDAYNLALSSKRFFATTGTGGNDDDSSDAPILATRLLRESLLSSLARVLEHSESGITLEAALSLGELPEGSALIAGSTMVQACLGVLWKGKRDKPTDVDIYCSAEAAPSVRSWLVERSNCMFNGFDDTYISFTDRRLLYTVDGLIHHVEKWGSFIENLKHEEGKDFKVDLTTLKETEYYKRTSQFGKNCQREYVDWKWQTLKEHGVSNYSGYSIRPKPGGDLPFDFDGRGKIDLIVAKSNHIYEGRALEITPFDLLDDFDLTICKCSFDGTKFHIPDPHLTFKAMSATDLERRDIVESYVKHFPFSLMKNEYTVKEEAAIVSKTIAAVRKENPLAPFYRAVDVAKKLPERYVPGKMFGPGSWNDDVVIAKFGGPLQFHNWVRKLVNRLQKYQKRGIEVVAAPAIEAYVFVPEFSVNSLQFEQPLGGR